jgi:hypothetical protein
MGSRTETPEAAHYDKWQDDNDPAAGPQDDLVNHPHYYMGDNGIEAIQVIEALDCSPEHHLAEALAHMLRYYSKAGREDLEKALWWLRRLANDPLSYQKLGRLDALPAFDKLANAPDHFPMDVQQVRDACYYLLGIFDYRWRVKASLSQELCLVRAIKSLEEGLEKPKHCDLYAPKSTVVADG